MLNLSPGPTHIPPFVLRAMNQAPMHHKSAETTAVFGNIFSTLQHVYGTQEPVLVFTGSGTLVGEIAIQQLAQQCSSVLTVSSGRFGQRWTDLCQRYGMKVHCVEAPWGEQPSLQQIHNACEKFQADAFVVVHSETSTGTFQDINAMCETVRAVHPDCFMIVDAITSVLVHEFHMDAWNIDVVLGSTQKGFGSPPGLGFLGVSERFVKELSPTAGLYGNIPLAIEQWHDSQVSFTPALHVLKALEQACEYIEQYSVERMQQRSAYLRDQVHAIVERCGLQVFSKSPANGVTAVQIPNAQAKHVKHNLEQSGILVGGGQDHLAGDIIRIGHMGFCEPRHVAQLIPVLSHCASTIDLSPDRDALMKIAEELLVSPFNDRSIE